MVDGLWFAGSWFVVPGIRILVDGFWYCGYRFLASGHWFLITRFLGVVLVYGLWSYGSWLLVSRFSVSVPGSPVSRSGNLLLCPVSGFWFLVSRFVVSGSLVSCFWFLVFGFIFRYLVSCFWLLGSRSPASGFWLFVPVSRLPFPSQRLQCLLSLASGFWILVSGVMFLFLVNDIWVSWIQDSVSGH